MVKILKSPGRRQLNTDRGRSTRGREDLFDTGRDAIHIDFNAFDIVGPFQHSQRHRPGHRTVTAAGHSTDSAIIYAD